MRREIALPARLLGIGLPLTIVVGTAAALVVLPGLAPIEAILLAIAVAPTDAALGAPVVADERVPLRIRQSLNVESGLNDGLCVPLLLIALAFAAAEGGGETEPLRLVVEEIAFGVIGGLLAGGLGALALHTALTRRWVARTWESVVPLTIIGLAYGLATILHGSGLIAAFIAGLAFGTIASAREERSTRADRDDRRCRECRDLPRLRGGDHSPCASRGRLGPDRCSASRPSRWCECSPSPSR